MSTLCNIMNEILYIDNDTDNCNLMEEETVKKMQGQNEVGDNEENVPTLPKGQKVLINFNLIDTEKKF